MAKRLRYKPDLCARYGVEGLGMPAGAARYPRATAIPWRGKAGHHKYTRHSGARGARARNP